MSTTHRCTSCDSDGDCALQDYSYEYGADLGHFGSLVPEDRELVYTGGHKGIVYDPAKCVRCQLCVKICSEVAMVGRPHPEGSRAGRPSEHGLRPAAERDDL